MSKVEKNKFYRPGTLEVPGTKVILKTKPFTNGVLFNIEDPISSFRDYLSRLNVVLRQYDTLSQLAGVESLLGEKTVSNDDIARLKLLVNFLVESPTEIKMTIGENDVQQNQ